MLKRYDKRSNRNNAIIIFDYTTCDDRFVISKFSLKAGKREFNKIFIYYNYEVILLAGIGLKSIDLFRFIDNFGCKCYIKWRDIWKEEI